MTSCLVENTSLLSKIKFMIHTVLGFQLLLGFMLTYCHYHKYVESNVMNLTLYIVICCKSFPALMFASVSYAVFARCFSF